MRRVFGLRGDQWYYVLLVSLTVILSWVALMLPLRDRLQPVSPGPGEVATREYRATETTSYTSLALTEQRRSEAKRNVLPVYTALDAAIARQRSERLRAALAYIDSLRADRFASTTQKVQDLQLLDDVQLSLETLYGILALTDSRWQAVEQGATLALERAMGTTIRPEALESARRGVPSLVSLSLGESEAKIAAELAASFLAPNSFFDQSATDAAQKTAVESVMPVVRSFVAGQTVVQRGQVLTDLDLEALQQLRLVAAPMDWREPLSAAALTALMTFYILLYFKRERALMGKPRRLTMVAILYLSFLIAARFIIPYHTVIPYAFPLTAYSLTVVALFGSQLALVTSVPLAIMVAFALPNSLVLTLYYLVGSLMGVLALGRAQRVSSFFWAGATIAGSGILVVVAYRLTEPATDLLGMVTLSGVSLFNGLATASLTILSQYFIAQLLGMTTPMQLMDLTRPDHPLMQMILHQAPGTYQHSLQVANLAEQAAERVGADPLLTRVGALYHDAGKAIRPFFFIENQIPAGVNPHAELDPVSSAQAIIRHVVDGVEVGRKYRLPRRLQDFMLEHHGTTLARYQYVKAIQAAGGDESQVEKDDFRYPGPRPQSRETAILMLADASEARVRAEKPKDEEELGKLVKSVFEERVDSGQLDDTHLTLQDLNEIYESFVTSLRGMYHPRIIYPQLGTPATGDVVTRPKAVEMLPRGGSLPSQTVKVDKE